MDDKIKQIKKDGYLIIKNLLNDEEISKLEESFEKKGNSKNDYFETDDNFVWEYLINNKPLESVKKILGSQIFYMHDVDLVETKIIDNKRSWHRDNPCRSTGKGPDWDKNLPYNVLTTITYLCSSKETDSNLNIILKSHKTEYKYSVSNILRLLHRKLLNIKYSFFLRNLIEKIIGKKINYNVGDCIVFFANTYHMGNGISKNNKFRKLIVARYGGPGKHSENFLNYNFQHRTDISDRYIKTLKQKEFFDFLKKNKIYTSLPKEKNEIEGVYSLKK